MRLIAIALMIFPVAALAQDSSGLSGFFSFAAGLGEDLWLLFTEETPSLIERFFAWLIQWLIMAKFWAYMESLKFFWGVASVIVQDLQIGSQLNSLIGFLPNDVQAAMIDLRIMDAIEMVVQAFIARFAMDHIN